jgi:hypothetical protein
LASLDPTGSGTVENATACRGIAFGGHRLLVEIAQRDVARPGDDLVFYNSSSLQEVGGLRTEPLTSKAPPQEHRLGHFSYLQPPDRILVDPNNPLVAISPERIAISPNGAYLAMEGFFRTEPEVNVRFDKFASRYAIAIVDIAKRTVVHLVDGAANSIDWSPDSTHLLVAQDEAIKVFDVQAQETIVDEGITASHSLARYTADGKYIIEVIRGVVEIWDGKHENLLQKISSKATCISVSRDGHYLALGGPPWIDSIPVVGPIIELLDGKAGQIIVYRMK